MTRVAVLVLALSLLLAGCSATVGLDRTSVPTGIEGGAAGTEQANPYGKSTLVVAIEDELESGRSYGPLVREALDYWERNDARYVGHEVEYELDPDATSPDIVVAFVERVGKCGSHDQHTAGCAPYITDPSQFDPPERVRIVGGFSNESTVRVLKHEFGHTLGLSHEDPPTEVMTAQSVLTTLPETDALDRSLAWPDRTLTVHIDLAGVNRDERSAVNRQVEATLAYFDEGAAGTVPENVSFVLTANREAADVVVQVDGETPCRQERGSCRRVSGLDPDGDGRLEQFGRVEVYVVGLDSDAVGWHVGRHVGYALSLDEESEYPEALRTSASYGERRSEWWAS